MPRAIHRGRWGVIAQEAYCWGQPRTSLSVLACSAWTRSTRYVGHDRAVSGFGTRAEGAATMPASLFRRGAYGPVGFGSDEGIAGTDIAILLRRSAEKQCRLQIQTLINLFVHSGLQGNLGRRRPRGPPNRLSD